MAYLHTVVLGKQKCPAEKIREIAKGVKFCLESLQYMVMSITAVLTHLLESLIKLLSTCL